MILRNLLYLMMFLTLAMGCGDDDNSGGIDGLILANKLGSFRVKLLTTKAFTECTVQAGYEFYATTVHYTDRANPAIFVVPSQTEGLPNCLSSANRVSFNAGEAEIIDSDGYNWANSPISHYTCDTFFESAKTIATFIMDQTIAGTCSQLRTNGEIYELFADNQYNRGGITKSLISDTDLQRAQNLAAGFTGQTLEIYNDNYACNNVNTRVANIKIVDGSNSTTIYEEVTDPTTGAPNCDRQGQPQAHPSYADLKWLAGLIGDDSVTLP